MTDAIFNECQTKMNNTTEALRRDFAKLRVGKATPALLESVLVEAYGGQQPMNQVGSIGAPEPRMLVVQPWDKGLMGAIEKAIRTSDLGLNPSNDGQVIRVPIPALTEERRKDLVKVAKNQAEESRIGLRNARREANDALKKAKKDGDLTEDQDKKGHDRVQELTVKFTKDIDVILAAKEKEILEI
jgi:ribosome recycling factor